ncbi:MAG TPA: Gfo/Idh/MocA family oxidoreductase [Actinomycetota bacterium]|nr:Gfo/Idh/MocA family oxidoreductase [Actinomycetota bacterium]
MSEAVRLASVGLGWWGGRLADAAKEAGAEIVTCFARSPAAREEFVERHNCRAAATLDELLSDPEVEGLLVATPHSTHATLVEEAAASGKHVFVEKPFTLTVAEGKRAVGAAEEAGIILQVGHNRRRQPAIRRLKAMVDEQQLGVLHHGEANLSYPKGLNPRSGWRGDPAESPAGGMMGLGVHMIDNLLYLLGRIKRLGAFSKQILQISRLDDATTIMLEFESGPLGFIGTSMVIPDIASTAVFGTEMAAWSDGDGSRFYVQNSGDQERTEQSIETCDTVRDELEEYARCIRGEGRPETGGAEGLEVIVVLEAVLASVRQGGIVDLDEIRSS